MSIGKQIRLKRLFSHPSGRLSSVAVDHFMGYEEGIPHGLLHIKPMLAAIVAGRPDAITMHKGILAAAWEPYAGQIPVILQGIAGRANDTAFELVATPEDAMVLGADAFAVAAFIRGKTEGANLRVVADCVRHARCFDLPVICHIYPRNADHTISYYPEDIAWAVRCATEVGADVVKVPYCGDVEAYRQIVEDCPVPVVAAGGPQSNTLVQALEMMADVVKSGARGATVGRNVWGFSDVTAAVRAFKLIIHDERCPAEALAEVGLT